MTGYQHLILICAERSGSILGRLANMDPLSLTLLGCDSTRMCGRRNTIKPPRSERKSVRSVYSDATDHAANCHESCVVRHPPVLPLRCGLTQGEEPEGSKRGVREPFWTGDATRIGGA